jgi:hypothetical protein
MSFNNCYRYLAGKFVAWNKVSGGDLSLYIQNNREDIRSHLDNDNFKSIFCNFFLVIPPIRNYTNNSIRLLKLPLSPIPSITLTQVEVKILIDVMLEICGRHEQAKKFLEGAMGFMLTALVVGSLMKVNQPKKRRGKSQTISTKRNKKSR